MIYNNPFFLNFLYRNLPKLDYFSQSDPMIVVYTMPFGLNQYREYARTETIQDTSNPDFTKKINIMYRFEEMQKLKFEVYDVDSASTNLAAHDFIGWVEITLGNLVSQKVMNQKIQFHNPSLARGNLIISAEELSSNKEEVEIQIVAHKLEKKGYFSSNNSFAVISKSNEYGDYVVVHKTEVVKTSQNPVWKVVNMPVRVLNNGDYEV